MPKLILIALGGSIGAVARYLLSGLVQRWTSGTFPGGTLFVNALWPTGIVKGSDQRR